MKEEQVYTINRAVERKLIRPLNTPLSCSYTYAKISPSHTPTPGCVSGRQGVDRMNDVYPPPPLPTASVME